MIAFGVAPAAEAECPRPSKPTVSIVAGALDASNIVPVTVQYQFPEWVTNRIVTVFVDGDPNVRGEIHPQSSSGTWSLNVDLNCQRSGTAVIAAYATSCSLYADPDYATRASAPVSINTTPEMAFTLDPADATGQTTAHIQYNFPGTATAVQRAVHLFIDGTQVFYSEPTSQSGTADIPVDMSCYRSGNHEFVAHVTTCKKWNDPDFSKKQTINLERSTKPVMTEFTVPQPDPAGQSVVRIGYEFPNTKQPIQRAVHLFIDGTQVYYAEPSAQTGTAVIPVDLSCYRTGTHTFVAHVTSCKKWNDADYAVSQTRTLQVSTKPAMPEFTVPSPDATGQSVVRIGYEFPNTNQPIQRAVHLYIDGTQVYYAEPSAQSGTAVIPVDLSCYRTGTHTFVAHVTSCKKWNDADYALSATRTLQLSTKPDVALSIDAPTPTGQTTARITFSFPNTRSHEQRALHLFVDGVQHSFRESDEQSGTWNIPLNTACLRPDTPVLAIATSCRKWDDTDFSDRDSTTLGIDNEPSVSVADGGGAVSGGRRIVVNWEFPNTNSVTQRRIELYRNDQILTTLAPTEVQGAQEFVVTGCGEVYARAIACSGDAAESTDSNRVALPVEACTEDRTSCEMPAKPVNYGSGDVSLSMPLFTIAHATNPIAFHLDYHSARPVYPSRTAETGFGWTHSFGETLRALDDDASRLYRVTADGREVHYQRAGTVWTAFRPADARGTVSEVGGTYRVADPDGMTRSFSVATGAWLATSDRWGNAVTAEYTVDGNLSALVDAGGRRITVDSEDGRLQEIVLPDGATWRFTYDAGSLSAIHDPLHTGATPWRSMTYVSDSGGQARLLTAMRDDAAKIVEGHAYDAQDRATTSFAEASCDYVTLEYDTPSPGSTRVTHVIDDVVVQRSEFTLQYQGGRYLPTTIVGTCATCGGTSGDTEVRQYDAANRVISRTDATGVVTQYAYDSNGHVSARVDAAGTSLERTAEYHYDLPGWPSFLSSMSEPAANGARMMSHVWSEGETVLTSTTSGRLVPGGPLTSLTTTNTYDARHRLIRVDGPRTDVADVSTFAYYADDDLEPLRRGRLQSQTSASGRTVTYDDYDVYGRARRITDANGVVTTIGTDLRGRVVSQTSHAVPGDAAESTPYTTTTLYDGRDRILETASAQNHVTRFGYEDGSDRLVETIRLDGSGNEIERKLLVLNVIGQASEERLESCQSPAPVCAAWTTRWRERRTYDMHNRLSAILYDAPAGAATAYTYDGLGRLASLKDENQSAANIWYEYDALGRLAAVRQKLAGAPDGVIVTRYEYDAGDNLRSVTDPNGNVTTYAYDDFGRMREQISPVSGTTTHTYDEAGNVLTTTDANGVTTSRAWDAEGRSVSATSAGGTAPAETVTWTWDDATPGKYGRGRLASMTDPNGVTTYAYDRRGRLRSESRTIGGETFVQTYGYDGDGNRKTIGYPSGRVVSVAYDFAGRPLSASGVRNGVATTYVSATAYLPFGPPLQVTYGNGTIRTREYDQRYRLTRNRLTHVSGPLADSQYAHDAVGNITAITDLLDGRYSRSFGYDELHRLTSATGGSELWGAGSFTYDRMGNMQSSTIGTRTRLFTYRGTTPQIDSVQDNGAVSGVTYDAAGNETAAGAESFTYSSGTHLSAGNGAVHAYDGRGIRMTTTQPAAGTSHHSFYTPELNLLAETAVTAAAPRPIAYEYIWFGGEPLVQIETATEQPSWYHTDHLGTPFLQTDATAAVVWQAEYDPWGSVHAFRTGAAKHQPLRFPGQESTGTGELAYNIFRWYRAGWGRYTQSDPILQRLHFVSADSGASRAGILAAREYSYGNLNPLTHWDRTGLQSIPHPPNSSYDDPNEGWICWARTSSPHGEGWPAFDETRRFDRTRPMAQWRCIYSITCRPLSALFYMGPIDTRVALLEDDFPTPTNPRFSYDRPNPRNCAPCLRRCFFTTVGNPYDGIPAFNRWHCWE